MSVAGGARAFRRSGLAAPLLLSAAIVAVAPFLGRLRDLALARFPSHALTVGTAAFVAGVSAALLLAALRIRRRRTLRYAGLGLCLALVWLQVAGFSTGIPAVDVVERLHLLEYGLLAVLFYLALRPLGGLQALVLAALAGLLVGTLDEWLQWLVASRVGEAGDVWLNAAATGTGLLFALVLAPPADLARRPGTRWRGRACGLAAVAVVVFGGFYHCAHLGYLIDDRDAGLTFRSWFAPDALPAVAAERQRLWRAGRTPTLDPLRREDYYFLEGTAHVAHRNASLERGDVASAWTEQRILERHYAPVLEQRGLHSGERLDLHPDRRERLRREASGERLPPDTSPVLADRIATEPSKRAWWTAIGLLAASLAGLGLTRSL